MKITFSPLSFFLFFLVALSSVHLVVAQTEEKKLTIDVKDTDIKDVIRIISKGYDINILLDQDISGKVTLHLVDVPIMEGLRSIAASNGLEVIQDGAVFKIKKASGEKRSMIRYANDKLTVDVQNMDVKEFLKELSSKTAVSIVPDAKVDGKVTGKLYEVSLDDGLRALLEGNGFKITRRKNIYQVLTTETTSSNSGTGMRYNNSPGSSGGSKFRVEYNDGKITLDVSNGDLEDVIHSIAEQSEAEIITYGSLKSEINAKLNDVPLTEALALLLGGTRFTFVQKDNVLLIGDRNTATPSGMALSKSELIHLRHIKADNIPSILPKDIPTTNVRVIKEQNALLISGTSEDIVQAREFLKTIDIPTPQVRIDAVIVEFKENLDKEFGIRAGRVPALKDSSYIITPFPEHTYYKGYQHFELGMSGKFIRELWNGMFPKNMSFIKKVFSEDFWAILRFLETQDKAKVLAQPSILTLNGNKASIDVSETQYFKVTTGVNENLTSRFQPIKFGIQLDIVPWISQSGQITAEITPNVSNSEKTNNEGYPNVSTRSITTTVRLNDGETLILGGLVKNQETVFNYKIPILGDIPILGIFFKHSGKTRTKSNLVVFITPHIVTDNQHIDLEREIEKYDLHDKNIIEQKIYKGVQKISKVLSGSSDETRASDSTSVSDNAISVAPAEKIIDSSSSVQQATVQPEQKDTINVTDKNRSDTKPVKQQDTLSKQK
jgi:type IV pilus assembly protein PilQ